MRIQKHLSEQGILSRREAEKYIKGGLIKVNGEVVRDLGRQIDSARDKVVIIGQKKIPAKTTVAVYKPRGYVSSKSKDEGETVFDLWPEFAHLNTLGRLDKESEGLLLLSDDGVLAKAVTGGDHRMEKEYEVTVREQVRPNMLRKMEEGMELEDGRTLPAKTELMDTRTFRLVLREGRKHQIRRMCALFRLTISKLKRIRVGTVTLRGLRPGSSRPLTQAEIEGLKKI